MFGLGMYIYAGEDLPTQEDTEDKPKTSKATKEQVEIIMGLYDEDNLQKILSHYKVEGLQDLSVKQASEVIKHKEKK